MFLQQDTDSAYREMAMDEERERNAQEWIESLIGDVAGPDFQRTGSAEEEQDCQQEDPG